MYSSGDRTWIRGRGGRERNSWPSMNSRHHFRVAPTDADGDVPMGGNGPTRINNRRRYSPGYIRGQRPRQQGGSQWHKVVVHNASSFEQTDFFRVLDMSTNESIEPTNVHTAHNKLIFFVKNERAKEAIRKLSGKLTVKGHSVSLYTQPAGAPLSTLPKEELKGHISSALEKRYVVDTNTLSLSNYSRDEDLIKLGVRPNLHKQAYLLGELIKEKCADMLLELDFSKNNLFNLSSLKTILIHSKCLKSVKLDNNNINRLQDISPLSTAHKNLEYLTLIGNPVKNIMEPAQYISDIRKLFPSLKLLDGLALPEKVKFEIDVDESLPAVQQSCINLPEPGKSAVLNFFTEYIKIFDSPESKLREQLTPAYAEMCLFSLAAHWPRMGGNQIVTPGELLKRSRNLKAITQADIKEKRLIVGREAVIKELCSLSTTQHYASSLQLDVSPILNNTITIVMAGLMKCDDGSRTFSRSFVVRVNPTNSSIMIVNDQISFTHVTPAALKKAESPVVPFTNGVPDQIGLIQRIQAATTMNADYSRKCLEGNGWDFDKSVATFRNFQANGSIPPEAFL